MCALLCLVEFMQMDGRLCFFVKCKILLYYNYSRTTTGLSLLPSPEEKKRNIKHWEREEKGDL
jgi:hypothetical protein